MKSNCLEIMAGVHLPAFPFLDDFTIFIFQFLLLRRRAAERSRSTVDVGCANRAGSQNFDCPRSRTCVSQDLAEHC
jgi:hypothetical protein